LYKSQKQQMEVKNSDGKPVGTVLGVENGRVKLVRCFATV